MLEELPMPESPAPVAHAVLLLDCSSSVRNLLPYLLTAGNEMIDTLRSSNGCISVVYFNRDVHEFVWRTSSDAAPRLSTFNYPIDTGTALYDAIIRTVNHLVAEHGESRGEMNGPGDVRIIVFTDGCDTASTATLIQARLAIGSARERSWDVVFVSNIAGLAGDLGIDQRRTVHLAMTPDGIRQGFRSASQRIDAPLPPPAPDDDLGNLGRGKTLRNLRPPPAAGGAVPPPSDAD